MIHYSVVPLEHIYQGIDTYSPNYLEVSHQGVMMQIEPLSGFQARIVRLLSCNPQDYLNEQMAPGSIIAYTPVISEKTL